MNKCELFERYIYDICGKTRTKMPRIVQYKLRVYAAWCDGYSRISYNPKEIEDCTKKELISIAAHELGHMRMNGKDRYISEYKAELFALKIVYKYYPKLFTLYYAINIGKESGKFYEKPFKEAIRDFKKWRKSNDQQRRN